MAFLYLHFRYLLSRARRLSRTPWLVMTLDERDRVDRLQAKLKVAQDKLGLVLDWEPNLEHLMPELVFMPKWQENKVYRKVLRIQKV